MGIVSCAFSNFDETNGLYTHDDIYSYFNETKQMLTNVYSYVPQDFGTLSGAMRDCATDDAEFGNTGADVQKYNNGNWSPINVIDSGWNFYKGIRAANEFIKSLETVDFSRYEYDTNYKNWMAQFRYFSYEARVLRAFYFFELAKRYGDIAMPTVMLTLEEANAMGKTSFNDVVEYIVKECDECAPNLPESYLSEPNSETGRVTKGFAMALKSKTLLYAASELHNPEMDTAKWKRAALAAQDIIESGIYELDPDDKCNDLYSPEVVFLRMNNNSSSFELNNFPIRYTEGKRGTPASATFPTQNLVDAFQTIRGYPVRLAESGWICEDPHFDPQYPYINRDKRMYRTLLYNGCAFKGSTIEVYRGGKDDDPITSGGTPTGYFLAKYIQANTSFVTNATVTAKHHYIIYRYAETLLTYAEAMIEAFGDPDYSDSEFKYSAAWALNQVRDNADMPDVKVKGKDEFIEALRNEWRVEFAFEDHRFWDVRRWKIGHDTQREIYGINIEYDRKTGYRYTRVLYETRSWRDCFNLYPIPQSELFKNPNLNPQNQGW